MVGDILVARYVSDKPITSDIAKQMVDERKRFMNNESCKMCIVFPKLNSVDKGGRDFLSSDEAKEGVEASAMVASSVLGRVIVNFFLKLNNRNGNDIPNKVFNSEEEAIIWLREIEQN